MKHLEITLHRAEFMFQKVEKSKKNVFILSIKGWQAPDGTSSDFPIRLGRRIRQPSQDNKI